MYRTKILRLKPLILCVSLLFSSLPLQAEVAEQDDTLSMASLLSKMPEGTIELLTHNDMLDLIDYSLAGARAMVRNRLGGETVLNSLLSNSAQLSLTTSTVLNIEKNDEYHFISMETSTQVDGVEYKLKRIFDFDWKLISDPKQ